MGLMDDQNAIGAEIQAKRLVKKAQDEAVEQAKEEAAKEMQRHEEDKKQGMI